MDSTTNQLNNHNKHHNNHHHHNKILDLTKIDKFIQSARYKMFKFRRRSLCSGIEAGLTPRKDEHNDAVQEGTSGWRKEVNTKPPRPRSEDRTATIDKQHKSPEATPTKSSFLSGERFKRTFFLGGRSGSGVCPERKRKERDSVSSGGGMKERVVRVNRSQSDDECGTEKAVTKDFKRTLSHDNFQHQHQKNNSAISSLIIEDSPPPQQTKYTSYSPEYQREMERSMNYVNYKSASGGGGSGKKHHHRKKRSSNESSSRGTSSSPSSSSERKQEDIPTVIIQEVALGGGKPEVKKLSFLDSIRGPDSAVLLSPRAQQLSREAIDLPPSPPMAQFPHQASQYYTDTMPSKMNALSEQLICLKKKLKELEEEHFLIFGSAPTPAEKLNNKETKKVLMQLAKVKREMRNSGGGGGANGESFYDAPPPTSVPPLLTPRRQSTVAVTPPCNLSSLTTTVSEISSTLATKRAACNRPTTPERMTPAELDDEKNLLQRQLLILERRHGRPSSKEEKSVVRELYERYRVVKRMGAGGRLELVPIMENATLELGEGGGGGVDVDKMKWADKSNDLEEEEEQEQEEGGGAIVKDEDFSGMDLTTLELRLSLAKEEKRSIRSIFRKLEAEFHVTNGRAPQKEDKRSVDVELYQKNKRVRATIRLLEVLVRKKKRDAKRKD